MAITILGMTIGCLTSIGNVMRSVTAVLRCRDSWHFYGLVNFPPTILIAGDFLLRWGRSSSKTSWGMVRFKPEEAPGNLSVTTDLFHREQLQRQLEQGQPVEIDVVMTGKLVPEESIVYDFSHDEEGLGLIMPFVRVERVDFVMKP